MKKVFCRLLAIQALMNSVATFKVLAVSISLNFPEFSLLTKTCDMFSRFCFVKFDNAKDARAAFEKGRTLKIGGAPVDVLYARLKKGACFRSVQFQCFSSDVLKWNRNFL